MNTRASIVKYFCIFTLGLHVKVAFQSRYPLTHPFWNGRTRCNHPTMYYHFSRRSGVRESSAEVLMNLLAFELGASTLSLLSYHSIWLWCSEVCHSLHIQKGTSHALEGDISRLGWTPRCADVQKAFRRERRRQEPSNSPLRPEVAQCPWAVFGVCGWGDGVAGILNSITPHCNILHDQVSKAPKKPLCTARSADVHLPTCGWQCGSMVGMQQGGGQWIDSH